MKDTKSLGRLRAIDIKMIGIETMKCSQDQVKSELRNRKTYSILMQIPPMISVTHMFTNAGCRSTRGRAKRIVATSNGKAKWDGQTQRTRKALAMACEGIV